MKLKDKKRVKFVTLTKGNKMKFEDRLAYSFLLASTRGLTVACLSRLSGLDRTKTLPSALARLAESELVKKEGSRHVGTPSEMVSIQADRDGAETWYERVNYLILYLPSRACPLTKKQNAVYCLKLAGKGATSLTAKLLNVSRPTVINAVRSLKQHGLLDAVGDPVPLPEDKLAWWEDKARTKANKGSDLEKLSQHPFFVHLFQQYESYPFEGISLRLWIADFDKFGRSCQQAGYESKRVVDLLWKAGERLHYQKSVLRVFLPLPGLLRKAEEATRANQGRGAFSGSSSFGLFKCKLDDQVKAEIRRKAAG